MLRRSFDDGSWCNIRMIVQFSWILPTRFLHFNICYKRAIATGELAYILCSLNFICIHLADLLRFTSDECVKYKKSSTHYFLSQQKKNDDKYKWFLVTQCIAAYLSRVNIYCKFVLAVKKNSRISISMRYSIIVFTLIKRSQSMSPSKWMLIINIRVTQIIMLIICVFFTCRRCTLLYENKKYATQIIWLHSVDMNDRQFGIGIRAQIEHTILMKSNSLDREYAMDIEQFLSWATCIRMHTN